MRTLSTVLFLLAGLLSAQAQERVWNAALDRYEYICRRCSEWRMRLDLGESVPRDSLRAMTQELSEVRKNLQYALGDMTPGQRRRFEAIRDIYASGQWTPPPVAPVLSPSPGFSAALGSPAPFHLIGRSAPSLAQTTPEAPRKKLIIKPFAGASIGVYPDLSFGLMAGITLGNWGLFIKGRSNFHTQKTTYSCLSDGTIEDGYFWSGDARTVKRHQIALNVSYAVWKPVSLYLGAGYGSRTLCWEDREGDWARVSDRSYRGPSVEAGLLIHPLSRGPVRGLTLLLGGSWLPRQYLDAEAGIAWRF